MGNTLNNPYEGVELLERFSDTEFEKYCLEKLNSVDKHVFFITELVKAFDLPSIMDIIEIGSGNGKLLFRLYMLGLINSAIGYEISNSRTEFAKKFKDFLKIEDIKIQLLCENYLEADLPDDSADLIIGIDVVINLIGPTSSDALDKLFAKSYSILREQGKIILEFMTCERELTFINNSSLKTYQTWKQFADSDPYIFGLDKLSLIDGNILWEKQFIKRSDGQTSSFAHLIMPITKKIVTIYANRHNLKATFSKYWRMGDDTSDQEFIVVLEKQ